MAALENDDVRNLDRAASDGTDTSPWEGAPPLTLEVISDAICPWCWVFKRRLDRVLASLSPGITAAVTWHPFELNSDMPKAGLDRRTYRSAKFGSWERSQALDAQVKAVAAGDGLEFHHERMERTPNTRDAHRVIWLAGQHGVQDAVVEGLFSAYFNEGRDVGDLEVLVDVGAAAGLDREQLREMLTTDQGKAEIAAEFDRAARIGVRSVPTVILNGRPVFSGAVGDEEIAVHLVQAARHAVR